MPPTLCHPLPVNPHHPLRRVESAVWGSVASALGGGAQAAAGEDGGCPAKRSPHVLLLTAQRFESICRQVSRERQRPIHISPGPSAHHSPCLAASTPQLPPQGSPVCDWRRCGGSRARRIATELRLLRKMVDDPRDGARCVPCHSLATRCAVSPPVHFGLL